MCKGNIFISEPRSSYSTTLVSLSSADTAFNRWNFLLKHKSPRGIIASSLPNHSQASGALSLASQMPLCLLYSSGRGTILASHVSQALYLPACCCYPIPREENALAWRCGSIHLAAGIPEVPACSTHHGTSPADAQRTSSPDFKPNGRKPTCVTPEAG